MAMAQPTTRWRHYHWHHRLAQQKIDARHWPRYGGVLRIPIDVKTEITKGTKVIQKIRNRVEK
jgi:hypothetical protein